MADKERIPVDLDSYIFELIEYDPTENPRGIVTAEEWNTILSLLKSSTNYTSKSLQEIVQDLYTATELSSTEPGNSGAALIGVEPTAGLESTFETDEDGNFIGNVGEVIKELVQQIKNIVLGEIPAGSLNSDMFAPNLNFTGESLTFNGLSILNESDIVQEINENSSESKIPSAKATYLELLEKQDVIEVGTNAPTATTKGNIYVQLENDIKEYYTKEEADALLKTKQPNLTAGSHITISNNVISADVPAAVHYNSFEVTTHSWGFTVHGGNWEYKDYSFDKAGYQCIGVVGFRRDGTNNEYYTASEHGAQLISNSNGKSTVRIQIKGTSNEPYIHGASGYYQLLWVKNV